MMRQNKLECLYWTVKYLKLWHKEPALWDARVDKVLSNKNYTNITDEENSLSFILLTCTKAWALCMVTKHFYWHFFWQNKLERLSLMQKKSFIRCPLCVNILCTYHRDRTRTSTLNCFCLFFPHLNMQKTCPNNTKNSLKSVIFSYLTMNNVRILLLL